ncbi:MAG: anti-sigma factor [Kofleriaceae bacterium]
MSLCQSIDTLAMAFLDDELVAEERRELELHILSCPGCRLHMETERAELGLIRKALTPPPAPDMVKARIARALDQEDREAGARDRQRAKSFVGRWMLPGSAMVAAVAAVFVAVFAVRQPPSPSSGAVAKEVVRQQGRTMPLEVQGASTGAWLRKNFAPIEPPSFRMNNVELELLGARLTAVSGHNAAELRYQVRSGGNQFTLAAVVIEGLRNEDTLGGTPIKLGDGTIYVHETNGMAAVTYVDEFHMGYAFASERLTAQELLELVVSSDLITRAQQGR